MDVSVASMASSFGCLWKSFASSTNEGARNGQESHSSIEKHSSLWNRLSLSRGSRAPFRDSRAQAKHSCRPPARSPFSEIVAESHGTAAQSLAQQREEISKRWVDSDSIERVGTRAFWSAIRIHAAGDGSHHRCRPISEIRREKQERCVRKPGSFVISRKRLTENYVRLHNKLIRRLLPRLRPEKLLGLSRKSWPRRTKGREAELDPNPSGIRRNEECLDCKELPEKQGSELH